MSAASDVYKRQSLLMQNDFQTFILNCFELHDIRFLQEVRVYFAIRRFDLLKLGEGRREKYTFFYWPLANIII